MPAYRALTWDHPRGYAALRAAAKSVAPAQGVDIEWDIQPLEGFESHPIADLCARYDLVVLDHPHVGEAVEAGCLVPLEEVFDTKVLTSIGDATIGPCLSSYRYAGKHWALPLDAATQVMAYRPDLTAPVSTWAEVEAISAEGGVALSTAGPHAILSFLSMVAAFGEPAATRDPGLLVSDATGIRVYDLLQHLYARSVPSMRTLNPIGILGNMAQHDDVRLCPLIYGYVNYTRPAQGHRALRFANAPRGTSGAAPGSTLGGTGIGLSKRCAVTPELVAHLRWLMDDVAQRQFIPAHDGQPSHRSAWADTEVNAAWGDFYAATAQTLEAAYVRPRYAGYIAWQTAAAAYLREALETGVGAKAAVATLNSTHATAIGDRER